MREFSNNVNQILLLDNISVFYLVKIVTKTSTIYDTTNAFPIEISGIGIFMPQSGLLTVEPPRLSSAIDREAYKLTYVDPTFTKRALFENGLTGAAVTVYAGFINTSGSTIGGIPDGFPMTDPADLIVVYGGIVDTQTYALDPNEGTVLAVIECSSPMASLGLTNVMNTSKDGMEQRNPTDTSFDQVHVGSGKSAYLWGKA